MIFMPSETSLSVHATESDLSEPQAQTTGTLCGCCFPGAWALEGRLPPTAVWAPGPQIPSLLSDRPPSLGPQFLLGPQRRGLLWTEPPPQSSYVGATTLKVTALEGTN